MPLEASEKVWNFLKSCHPHPNPEKDETKNEEGFQESGAVEHGELHLPHGRQAALDIHDGAAA